MITELLTWGKSDEDGTPDVLQFSHGVWILAKRVLVHLSKYSKTQETVDFSKTQVLLAGHSLGGGAAFLTTLVLSCIRPNETPIACVTFGQPRVLVTPLDRGPEPSRQYMADTKEDNNGAYEQCLVQKKHILPSHCHGRRSNCTPPNKGPACDVLIWRKIRTCTGSNRH